MATFKREFIGDAEEIVEINNRIRGHETVLMQYDVDKTEGWVVPEQEATTTVGPNGESISTMGSIPVATPPAMIVGGVQRSAPIYTAKALDDLIKDTQKKIEALRARRKELGGDAQAPTS